MPNWIGNKLYIRGPKSEISAFRKQGMGDWWESYEKEKTQTGRNKEVPEGRSPLLFENFFPFVVNAQDRRIAKRYTKGRTVYPPEIATAYRLWGTKWDAHDATLEDDKPGRLKYWFLTAGNPPLPWLYTVSRKYPRLVFSLHYVTENNERGIYRVQKGKDI